MRQIALDIHGKAMLEQRTDFTAIRAMTITDREEMTVFESHNVRVSDVSVLVHLVRIMR